MVVDIGPIERNHGLSYVALSRVRNIRSLLINPFKFKRLGSLRDKPSRNKIYELINALCTDD